MEKVYRLFLIKNKAVEIGAPVKEVTLANGAVTLQVLEVGESGRGRKTGHIICQGAYPDELVKAVSITATRAGAPKFLVCSESKINSEDHAVVVMRCTGGYRGRVSYIGDYSGLACNCDPDINMYTPWPGEVLTEGYIAEGTAGYMGQHNQIISLILAKTWFGINRYGRIYDSPPQIWYWFDGKELFAFTKEERELFEETMIN